MSATTVTSEKELQAIAYAKNYPHVVVDTPMMGPFSVGNINEYNGRVIINVCVRTEKSHPRNATISYPKDWPKASQFKPGDQVNIAIEKGLIKRMWHAKAEPVRTVKVTKPIVSAAAVNEEVGQVMEELEAEESVDEIVKEAFELVPQEADANTDDLPF